MTEELITAAGARMLAAVDYMFQFPSTYLVLDCETTGFDPMDDYIIDAGWAVVKDRHIVNHQSLLLDWNKWSPETGELVRRKIAAQEESYAKDNRPHYYPWERLCDEGVNPVEVIYTYAKLIHEHINMPDSSVIGHGFWRFDRSFIDTHTTGFLDDYLLPWRSNSIFDTGLFEKALQMGVGPCPSESLDDWFRRIESTRAPVKWSLENTCVPKYNLRTRYQMDMRLMHTAGFDCVAIHYLLDTFRQLMEIMRGERTQIDGEAAYRQARYDKGPEGLCDEDQSGDTGLCEDTRVGPGE